MRTIKTGAIREALLCFIALLLAVAWWYEHRASAAALERAETLEGVLETFSEERAVESERMERAINS
jgi:hypothetical protein